MALIITPHGNSAFRSEEVEGAFHLINDNIHRKSKDVGINFKSGIQMRFCCKTVKEAHELLNCIIEAMKHDRNGK